MKKSRAGLLFSGKQTLRWPVKGQISSYFGKRWRKWHYGLDIRAPKGSAIFAAASGQVVMAGWQRGYGNTVVVNHRNFRTLYAHCNDILVSKGDIVGKGQKIATIGKTGNASGYHLHFEVRTKRWTALNPLDHLPRRHL